MDLAWIPVEILEQILSKLPFDALLDASLVCHRWKHIADRLIVLRGNFRIDLEAVEYDNRSYQSFVLRNPFRHCYRQDCTEIWKVADELESLRPVLETFISKFKTVRGLKLAEMSEYYAYHLFEMFRSWFESMEWLDIDCFADREGRSHEGVRKNSKKHIVEFPKLKHLRWIRGLEIPLTLIAPNLEMALLLGETRVKLLNCDKLKRVECKPCSEIRFASTFEGKLPNLTSLKVWLPLFDYELPLLNEMKALRWLELLDVAYDTQARVLDELYKCNELLGLKFEMYVEGDEEGILDLRRLFKALPKLRQLELGAVILQLSGPVIAQNLVQFKMKGDVTIRDTVRFSAPNLEMLVLPANQLQKLHLPDNFRLTQLYVYTDDFGGLKRSFESDVGPFLLTHSTVKDLIVINAEIENSGIDRSTYDGIQLDVERLELRDFTVSLKFFRQLTLWNSLKHLSLIACTIDCRADSTNSAVVDLPRLETMQIDNVYTVGSVVTPRTTFPLSAERTREVVLEDAAAFRSKDLRPRRWETDPDSECRYDVTVCSAGIDWPYSSRGCYDL